MPGRPEGAARPRREQAGGRWEAGGCPAHSLSRGMLGESAADVSLLPQPEAGASPGERARDPGPRAPGGAGERPQPSAVPALARPRTTPVIFALPSATCP